MNELSPEELAAIEDDEDTDFDPGDRIAQLLGHIYALKADLRAKDERIRELRRVFGHIHVNAQDGTDACKKCGLDLRDDIHYRDPDERLMEGGGDHAPS